VTTGRGPLVPKQSVHKAKGPHVEKLSACEALVTRSPPRFRVNKIGPRASGSGLHVMGKCPLKRKMSTRVGQRSACGAKIRTYCSNDQYSSWVFENENGQRARGRPPHTAGEMVLANEEEG
jgi:hypothetical protein